MIRTFWRAIIALAAIAMMSLAVTPAHAATAVPNTISTATLTSASVTFTTNDEDKDADTEVEVDVYTKRNVHAATVHDYFGHFDDYSAHGPYPLYVFPGIKASDLNPGDLQLFINPNGNDTWRFTYSLTLNFSDGTSFVFSERNRSLDEFSSLYETSFVVTTQVQIPNVVGKTQAAASTALQAAGLTLGSVSHTVDSKCEYINTVKSESPGAGTPVALGTAVDVVIGDAPKTPCP